MPDYMSLLAEAASTPLPHVFVVTMKKHWVSFSVRDKVVEQQRRLNWIYWGIRCLIRPWKQHAPHDWRRADEEQRKPSVFINIKIALSLLIIGDMSQTLESTLPLDTSKRERKGDLVGIPTSVAFKHQTHLNVKIFCCSQTKCITQWRSICLYRHNCGCKSQKCHERITTEGLLREKNCEVGTLFNTAPYRLFI